MRFAAALLGCSLVFTAVVHGDDFECNGQEDYLYPDSSNCRYYHVCTKGSTKSSEDACFIFFRKFNPEKERCDWCWNVDCSAKPSPPPTSPPPATSPPPVTGSSTPASSSTASSSTTTTTSSPSSSTPKIPTNSKLLARIMAGYKKKSATRDS